MKASKDFLMALGFKLSDIASRCSDLETKGELIEFMEVIDETILQIEQEELNS